jgi:hypothetical protein
MLPKTLITTWWNNRVKTLKALRLLSPDANVPLTVSRDRSLRDSHRHYAATNTRTLAVAIHADALKLLAPQVLAILLHELGHVIEHADTVAGNNLIDRAKHEGVKDEEARADWLAGRVFEVSILYDPKTKVQTLGQGLPRPVGLE